MIPDYLVLETIRKYDNISKCLSDVIYLSEKIGDSNVVSIRLPQKNKKIEFAGKLENLPSDVKLMDETSLVISLDNGNLIKIILSSENFWTLNYYINTKKIPEKQLIFQFQILKKICLDFFQSGNLQQCRLRRERGRVRCIPIVPIIDANLHIILATEKEISDNYTNSKEFLEISFDSLNRKGDAYLITLSETGFENNLYLKNIIHINWALARLSKPGITKYFPPEVLENEENIFKSGEGFLEQVGYIKGIKTLEFSCYLEKNGHLPGWEIYNLMSLLKKGKLQSGEVLSMIRVVFYTKEMADSEKRPLLDIGVKVFYQSDSTDIIEITE